MMVPCLSLFSACTGGRMSMSMSVSAGSFSIYEGVLCCTQQERRQNITWTRRKLESGVALKKEKRGHVDNKQANLCQ